MLSIFLLIIILVLAVLWYHDAIIIRPTKLESMKGFNFIYKEHRNAYRKSGETYKALVDLLEKNAKNIQSHIVSGNLFLENEHPSRLSIK